MVRFAEALLLNIGTLDPVLVGSILAAENVTETVRVLLKGLSKTGRTLDITL